MKKITGSTGFMRLVITELMPPGASMLNGAIVIWMGKCNGRGKGKSRRPTPVPRNKQKAPSGYVARGEHGTHQGSAAEYGLTGRNSLGLTKKRNNNHIRPRTYMKSIES